VPHEEDERPEHGVDRVQDRPVPRVGQLARGARERDPANLVHLRVRLKDSIPDRHDPVADRLLAAPPVAVPRFNELGSEETVESRLLGDLAEGALLVRLAPLDLPLREGPIAVAGAMDEEDLAAAVGPGAENRAAGGPDLGR
jgi:hypothetical protein